MVTNISKKKLLKAKIVTTLKDMYLSMLGFVTFMVVGLDVTPKGKNLFSYLGWLWWFVTPSLPMFWVIWVPVLVFVGIDLDYIDVTKFGQGLSGSAVTTSQENHLALCVQSSINPHMTDLEVKDLVAKCMLKR